jgi:hypothetical protein
MNRKLKERIIVAVAALVFFAAFSTIALMDRTHGTNGDGIGANEVNVDVMRNDGHVTIPTVPDSLLVLAAGVDAKVDFEVENNDRDNDIDTILVEVPGSVMINGSTEWYDPNFLDHEWDVNLTSTDEVLFEARDDWFGRVFGGSAQYDVVGNQDDALDHFEQNATIPVSVSEAITVTAEFTAPSVSGIKKGNEGMQVSVGDLQTEETSSELTSLYSNGYPYLVIDDGYEVVVIDVNSDQISLEVQYGSRTLFSGTTRSVGDYKQADEGISYVAAGHTYAILEAPTGDEVIKPVIKGSVDATGNVEIKMQEIRVKDKTQSGTDLFEVVDENQTVVPIPPVGETYKDTDGDWIYDIEDDDDDGDNIPDERDPEPLIPGTRWINEDPSISNVMGPLDKVKTGESFDLQVTAEDSDNDPLTFVWTLAGSNWTAEGSSVSGPEDLEAGTYTFTITVTDDKGGESVRTIDVDIEEKDDDDGGISPIVLIVIAILVLIIIVVVIFMMKKGGEEEEDLEEEEDIEELEPEGEDLPSMAEPSLEGDLSEDEDMLEEEGDDLNPEEVLEEELEEEDFVPSISEGVEDIEVSETVVGETCPHCNTPLEPTDAECPNCGMEFDIELECPICGEKVDQSMETCPSCGVSFM